MRSSLWLGLPVIVALLACGSGDRNEPSDPQPSTDLCGGALRRGSVDTGSTLETEAAVGVGVFVEYELGGSWHVFTTCDTDLSDAACSFDIVLQTADGSSLLGVAPDDLEQHDRLTLTGDDAVRVEAITDFDFDGVWVDTDPGTVLSIDVILDNDCGNAYVYWIGDGAVHEGAPSTPFELEPSEP